MPWVTKSSKRRAGAALFGTLAGIALVTLPELDASYAFFFCLTIAAGLLLAQTTPR